MKPPIEELIELIVELESIAEKNNDKFRYRIDIKPVNNRLRFKFVCEEAEEGHVFISQQESTLEAAITEARNDIADACRLWEYEQ